MNGLLEKVAKFSEANKLFARRDRILVAVSGGADSIAMLHILDELGVAAGIAHVNYGLRDQAEMEMVYVKELANRMGIPVHVLDKPQFKWNHKKGESFQNAARKARYQFFEKLIEKEGYLACATGHHADDQTETRLFSLLRSLSTRILKSIPVRRGPYIRPMLECSHAEIMEYLEEEGLAWFEDESNQEEKYLRNKIRHSLIPALSEIHPNFQNALAEKAEMAGLYQEWFAKELSQWPGIRGGENMVSKFDLRAGANRFGKFLDLALLIWLEEFGITGMQAREVLKLRQSRTGAKREVEEFTVFRERNDLIIRSEVLINEALELSLEDCNGKKKSLNGRSFSLEIEKYDGNRPEPEKGVHWLDLEKVDFPIEVTGWIHGRKMQPLGMQGQKKLSDIFVDQKWTAYQKAQVLVFRSGKTVILVSEFRISELVKLGPQTKNFLRITID